MCLTLEPKHVQSIPPLDVTLTEFEGSINWNFSDRNLEDVSTGQTIRSEA